MCWVPLFMRPFAGVPSQLPPPEIWKAERHVQTLQWLSVLLGKGCVPAQGNPDIRPVQPKSLLIWTAILQAAGEHPHSLQPQETSAQQLSQACCRSRRDTPLNKAGGQEIHHISEARRPALEGQQLIHPPDQGLSFLQA